MDKNLPFPNGTFPLLIYFETVMLSKRLPVLVLFGVLILAPYSNVRSQWAQTNGMFGGNIVSLSSGRSNIIAEVAQYNGFYTEYPSYISSNNGKSWDKASAPNGLYMIETIDTTLFGISGQSLYSSQDGGLTWTAITASLGEELTCITTEGSSAYIGTDQGHIYRYDIRGGLTDCSLGLPKTQNLLIRTMAASRRHVFAGIDGAGIFRLSDHGWEPVNDGLPANSVCNVLSLSDTTLIDASFEDGIYISNDSGSHWSSAGLEKHGTVSMAVRGTNIFVSTGSVAPGGVYLSTDWGTNWKWVSENLPTNGWITSVLPIDSNLFVGTGEDGIFLSSDNGFTWSSTDSGIPYEPYLRFTKLAATDSALYVGTSSAGLLRSTDRGGTWRRLAYPQLTSIVNSFYISGPDMCISSGNCTFISHDSGKSGGQTCSYPVTDVIAVGNEIFVGTDTAGIFLLTSTTPYWIPKSNSLFNSRVVGKVTGHEVHWDTINIAHQISAIKLIGRYLFAGTAAGLYVSNDTGVTWILVDSSLTTINAFANIDTAVFIGTSSGVLRCSNIDDHWRLTEGYLFGNNVHDLKTNNEIVFVACDSGVFFSNDSGKTWRVNNRGLPVPSIVGLAIKGNDVFAAPKNSDMRIYRNSRSDFENASVVKTFSSGSLQFRIYPNPLSQSTTISFTPATSGYAEISIVNQLGVEVARIFSGELGAGEHSFTWQAQAPSPGPSRKQAGRIENGMYECVVRMNGRSETLPIVLLH